MVAGALHVPHVMTYRLDFVKCIVDLHRQTLLCMDLCIVLTICQVCQNVLFLDVLLVLTNRLEKLFPVFSFITRNAGNRSLKYLLDSYFGLDKHQINYIKNIKNSRWVTIIKTYPSVLISEQEAIVLNTITKDN